MLRVVEETGRHQGKRARCAERCGQNKIARTGAGPWFGHKHGQAGPTALISARLPHLEFPVTIAIATETPLQDDVRLLVAELNATLMELTPPEHCHHLTVEQMADATTTVFVARDGGQAVACGALKRHGAGIGEVKRMYTRPSHRGRKLGALILERIERWPARRGWPAWCWKPATAIPPPGRSMNARVSPAAGRCSIIPTSNGRCSTRRTWPVDFSGLELEVLALPAFGHTIVMTGSAGFML